MFESSPDAPTQSCRHEGNVSWKWADMSNPRVLPQGGQAAFESKGNQGWRSVNHDSENSSPKCHHRNVNLIAVA